MTLGVVQFIHPGPEDRRARRGADELAWNDGAHNRKFLASRGSWCSSKDGELESGPLVFWGEWEAEARVARRWPAHGEFPRATLRPFWRRRRSYAGLQNTDPFVFGGPFLYGNCRQGDRPALRELDRGTLILFGSKRPRRNAFILDTVFVVAESPLYEARSARALDGWVPAAYEEITRKPLAASTPCGAGGVVRLRLYRGATHANPVDGMFSFVPCLPNPEGDARFPRPTIVRPPYVNPANGRTQRVTPCDLRAVRAAWDAVTAQVTRAELALGVAIAMPNERP